MNYRVIWAVLAVLTISGCAHYEAVEPLPEGVTGQPGLLSGEKGYIDLLED